MYFTLILVVLFLLFGWQAVTAILAKKHRRIYIDRKDALARNEKLTILTKLLNYRAQGLVSITAIAVCIVDLTMKHYELTFLLTLVPISLAVEVYGVQLLIRERRRALSGKPSLFPDRSS